LQPPFTGRLLLLRPSGHSIDSKRRGKGVFRRTFSQRCCLSFAFALLMLSLVAAAEAQQATGLIKETPEGEKWLAENYPPAELVRPNLLSVARLNSERLEQGLPMLSFEQMGDIALFGSEAVPGVGAPEGTAVPGDAPGVPQVVDNSELDAFPPIRSQGGIGSCTTWAVTYYQFTFETAMSRGWKPKTDGND